MEMRRYRMALAMLLGVAASQLSAGQPEVLQLWYSADITISPEGGVATLSWRDVGEKSRVVLDRLEPVVRGWEFRPGSADGVPAETVSVLSIRVEAREGDDGSFALAVAEAGTGPSTIRAIPPEYPRDALVRGACAEVKLAIAIDAQGKREVTPLAYRHNGRGNGWLRKDFESAAVAAASQWPVHQERVAGRPVPARIQVPVIFCIDNDKWCAGLQDAAREADASHAAPLSAGMPMESVVKLMTDARGGI